MLVRSRLFGMQEPAFLALFLLPVLLVMIVTGCGGSGDDPQPAPTPTPSPTATPSPTPAPTPVFTSVAPAEASEGELYTYEISAIDPAGSAVTFSLVAGPPGAGIDASTLTWTPDHSHSRRQNDFTILARTGHQGEAVQSFGVTPKGTIVGTAVSTYVTRTGNVRWPELMGTHPPVAYVPDGEGFTVIPGTGSDEDGSFAIARIPAGTFLISARYDWISAPDSQYLVQTTSSDLDLGQLLPGRPDCIPDEPIVSRAYFNSPLSDPSLAEKGHVAWYSGNSNYWNDWTVSWMPAGLPWVTDPFEGRVRIQAPCLIEWTRGDDAWAFHYVPADSNPEMDTIAESIGPLHITQLMEEHTFITDPFVAATTNLTIHPVIKFSEFDTLLDRALPDDPTIQRSNRFAIVAQPYSSQVLAPPRDLVYSGESQPAPDLLRFGGSQIADLDFGVISLSNPLPDHTPYTLFERRGRATTSGPGGSGAVGVRRIALPDVESPIEPLLGPVVSPKIDGQDFFLPNSALSLTPTLTWDPPSLGTANRYIISVHGTPSLRVILHTRQTQITIPPGIIQPGMKYTFVIAAIADSASFDSAPLRISGDHAYASSVSAVNQTP